jgi:hypothetical protein
LTCASAVVWQLLIMLCEDPNGLVLAGDTAQVRAPLPSSCTD